MMFVQKILANDREFEIGFGMPCETRVQFGITGDGWVGQAIDITNSGVEFEVKRQFEGREQGKLILRAGAFVH